MSCLCPGKKDCMSVKLEDGRKEKVQKRLLLSSLKEIYQHFMRKLDSLHLPCYDQSGVYQWNHLGHTVHVYVLITKM